MLAGARDGETFLIQKSLDVQHRLHIFVAVHALAGTALHRLELRKFRFPKAQHVRWQVAEFGDFADPEIKFFWNHDIGRLDGLRRRFATRIRRDAGCSLHWRAVISPTGVSSTTRRSEQLRFSSPPPCLSHAKIKNPLRGASLQRLL